VRTTYNGSSVNHWDALISSIVSSGSRWNCCNRTRCSITSS